MYSLLLTFHSYFRWVVLIAGVLAAGYAWIGLMRRSAWLPHGRKLGLAYLASADLQLVVGLLLYAVFSPFARLAFANFGAAMKDANLRFFAVEHALTQLLAVVLLHVGNLRVKRAPNDALRYRRFALYATLALVLMLVGTPWPMLDVGRPLFR
jgi:hypothetical protein